MKVEMKDDGFVPIKNIGYGEVSALNGNFYVHSYIEGGGLPDYYGTNVETGKIKTFSGDTLVRPTEMKCVEVE